MVNLKNVSYINIAKDRRRIVFNMNYGIEIEKNGEYKYISDYVYWDMIDDENFEFALKYLQLNEFIKHNFIAYASGYINRDEISSIKFAEKKKRVIFNLSHSITFVDYHGHSRITSEFVYVDFDRFKDYQNFISNTKLN